MLKVLPVMAAGAAAACSAAHASPLSQWMGVWENPASDIVAVTISEVAGAVTVAALGKCTPTPCDWGAVPANVYSPSAAAPGPSDAKAIIAVFNQGFATKTMLLDDQTGDSLRVHVFTDFNDASGRSDYALYGSLMRKGATAAPNLGESPPARSPQPIAAPAPLVASKPAPPPAGAKAFAEDCIAIDPSQVAVANPNGSWKLVQGSMWILDAGKNQSEMETARAIVRRYGLDQQCFVGRPDPSLSYWLVGGAAPEGAFPGEDCVSINPASLSVQPNGPNFTIVSEGDHWAFSAPSQAEAEAVTAVIRYYGFTRSCYVGRPGPSMAYLRR
jgi:hypothetical protein